MEITKSPIEAQIEADLTDEQVPGDTPEETAEEAAAREKVLRVLRALRNGNLTFKQFKQLPKQVQVSYERRYGRPKTPDQIRAAEKTKAKRRSTSKRARAARKGR